LFNAGAALAQDGPPLPAEIVVQTNPPPVVKVVKPKQGTGNFAVMCPDCERVEIVKALTIRTNGCRTVQGGMIVEMTVTAKCPRMKRKFEMSAERFYKARPKAVEVDAAPDK